MLSAQPDRIGRLEHAATAGVILLAVGSFVLSYDALHQLAVTNHVPRPLAWIWPLIVDGFIITASFAVRVNAASDHSLPRWQLLQNMRAGTRVNVPLGRRFRARAAWGCL